MEIRFPSTDKPCLDIIDFGNEGRYHSKNCRRKYFDIFVTVNIITRCEMDFGAALSAIVEIDPLGFSLNAQNQK